MNCITATDIRLKQNGSLLSQEPFSFHFPVGKITALMGKNGAGKTTLLRALTGERRFYEGTIRLFEITKDTSSLSPKELSQHLAYVPQEHPYPGDLTVFNFVKLARIAQSGLLSKMADCSEEIDSLLKCFNLLELKDQKLAMLSSGERQKVFVSRAFLQQVKLILLDEPTNHMDPGAVRSFWNDLVSIAQNKNLSVVVSSHDLESLRARADWVLALKFGSPFYCGSSAAFFGGDYFEPLFGV